MTSQSKTRPLVSIITPVYNHEPYISECIESVLSQTYSRWEMFIVDDGSTDGSWQIVQSYASKDPRIRAFRQANKGIWRLAETYNFALERSSGDLVAILEGDDVWPQNKLETQTQLHSDPDKRVIFSYGHTRIVSETGETLGLMNPYKTAREFSSLEFLREILQRRTATMPVSCLISTQALNEIGGFQSEHLNAVPGFISTELYPAVDYPTFTRLFLECDGVVSVAPTVLGLWRKHTSQTTHKLQGYFAQGMYQIALKRLQRGADENKQVNLSEVDILHSHRKYLCAFSLNAMRRALIEKDRAAARVYARRLWVQGGPKRKLQGLYGWALAILGFNMEHVFSLYEQLHALQRRNSK